MAEFANGGFVSGEGEPLVFGGNDGYVIPKRLIDKWLTDANYRDALQAKALADEEADE